MKKLIIVIAVLCLMAGTAYAAALDDGLTRQVWAQQKGRVVVSGTTCVMRFWYDGSGAAPGVGVSSNTSITLYSDVTTPTIDTTFTTSAAGYDTVAEVVASANSVSGWHAEAGPDGYDTLTTNAVLHARKDIQYPGRTEPDAAGVYYDQEGADVQICGVNPEANKTSRIKSLTHKICGTGDVRVRIKNNGTTVWEEYITDDNYNDVALAGTVHASPNTITFSNTGEKGISGDMGKPLCVEVARTTIVSTSAGETSESTVAIVYDQF